MVSMTLGLRQWHWVGLLLLSLSLVSCWPKSSKVPDDLLRITLGPGPATLDWHLSRDARAGQIAINISQGLFTYDMDISEVRVIPQLVEHFHHSDDFTQWNFCLKPDLRWGDGKPLKAEHFIESWKRLLDAKTGSPHASRFYSIKGAREFHHSKGAFKQVGLRVDEKDCLEVTLKHPVPFFSKILTAPFTFPVRVDLIAASPSEWMLGKAISLGPYYVDHHKGEQKTQLKTNPNYKGDEPEAKEIELLWVDDKATSLRLFRKHKLDVVKSPDLALLPGMGLQSQYIFSPGVGLSYLGFNTQTPLGRRRDFRQAVKAAIFGPALKSLVTDDGIPQQGLWPPFLDLHNEAGASEAPAPSKQKIFANKAIKIQSNFTPLNEKIMSYVAYRLKRELGLRAEIQLKESKTYFSELGEKNPFTLFRSSWVPAILDPHAYVDLLSSTSAQNFSFLKSQKLDNWIEQAAQEFRPVERKKLYDKIATWILEDEVLLIPLYLHKNAFLIDDKRWQYQPHFSERLEFRQFHRPLSD